MKHFILSLFLLFFIWFPARSEGEIRLIPNAGQWDKRVKYSGEINGGRVFFEPDGFTYHFQNQHDCHGPSCSHDPEKQVSRHHVFQMKFEGSSPVAGFSHDAPFSERYNFYLGKNNSTWTSGILAYENIQYTQLYPGIDMVVYSQGNSLKYDFHVQPDISIELIQMKYQFQDAIALDREGNLRMLTSLGEVMEMAPVAFQIIAGVRQEVPCRFKLTGNMVSFELPEGYDPTIELIIDPVLVFGTYTGSRSSNWGFTATYDKHGNAFAGGIVFGSRYPTTMGAFQTTYGGGSQDVVISKFSPDGKSLIFSTFLGGSDTEQPHSMVTGVHDELYVFGRTFSGDFPVSAQAYDTTYNGRGDIFITSLDSLGGLLASTYLGGTKGDAVLPRSFANFSRLSYNYGDDARGEITLDDLGNCYIATVTASQDFPIATLPIASFGGGLDGCVAKLSPDLSDLLWSSYFGGSKDDAVYSIETLGSDHLYLVGGTESVDFPGHPQSANPTFLGDMDGFVAKFNLKTSTLEACSFLGTSVFDQAYFVELDKEGFVYVFGQTLGNIPTGGSNYSIYRAKQFILKMPASLDTFEWISTFGTRAPPLPDISPTAFLVDNCGRIYVAGWGPMFGSPYQGVMPLSPDAFQDTTDFTHFYLGVFEKDMDSLVYGTYFGELDPQSPEHVDGGTSRFDKKGVVYQAVCASCAGTNGFPTTPGAWSRTNGTSGGPSAGGGYCNMALFKFDFQLPSLTALFRIEDDNGQALERGCNPLNISLNNYSSGFASTMYQWDFGDGSPHVFDSVATHTYSQPGVYQVMLIAEDPNSCNPFDTTTHTVEVFTAFEIDAGPDTLICGGEQIFLQADVNGAVQFHWSPSKGLSDSTALHPLASPVQKMTYYLSASDQGECSSRDSVQIKIQPAIHLSVSGSAEVCVGGSTQLSASGANTYSWSPILDLGTPDRAQTWAYPLSDQVYTVIGDKDSLCSDTGYVSVSVIPTPVTVATGTPILCQGKTAVLTASGGERYIWSTGSTNKSTYPTPAQTTTYLVTGYNKDCKGNTDSITVAVLPQPIAAFTPHGNGGFAPQIIHFENLSQFAKHYVWDFGDGKTSDIEVSPTHTYTGADSFVVTLIASNDLGCKDKAVFSFSLEPTTFWMPNAFTPNGQAPNDKFFPISNGSETIRMQIFNRWGKLLFDEEALQPEWDGNYKGKTAPEGVYYYQLQVKAKNGRLYEKGGTVTLIR